ncbi:MAG: NAD(P)/FAD-dependent oxidoreductase [Alphaproteobacteria bacterium]
MAESVDSVVVGAGVVGLAVARRLALAGREVVVLEAEGAIGSGNSSRNSEVIHAGLYYPKGSLKGRFCVAGKAALYAYARDRGIAHDRVGKLIVAAEPEEEAALARIEESARANGVDDLRRLDRAALRTMEPELAGRAALLSPSTGIIDSHGLMLAYQGDAEHAGAVVALHSRVAGGRVGEDGLTLRVETGRVESGAGGPENIETLTLDCRAVVNCAGLGAQSVAGALDGLAPASIPARHLGKGSYFTLSGAAPFRRLIYPVPVPGSLGLHYTRDLGGQAKFGPDIEWVDGIDYTVEAGAADKFYAAIRRYWPGLADGALLPGYAGIRPKLHGPDKAFADFAIQGPADHAIPGLVNLYGIESPGLTASLAIADHVAALLGN